MIVAIGDIHGEVGKLNDLMAKLNKEVDFANDTLVFLGDYVDGGKYTYHVVQELIEYEKYYPHWQFLYGNHEDLMLDVLIYGGRTYHNTDLWIGQGGLQTIQSYGGGKFNYMNVVPAEHIDWLKTRPLTFETDSYIFVHAGFDPGEDWRNTPHLQKIWLREEFYDSGYNFDDKTVVYGHTYSDSPRIRRYCLGIDTMAHGHGSITAAILPEAGYGWPNRPKFVTSVS